jgi:hypothetical protein
MTRWAAVSVDNPDVEAGRARRRHAEEHFAHLAGNRDKIVPGGALRPMRGTAAACGRWRQLVARLDGVGA